MTTPRSCAGVFPRIKPDLPRASPESGVARLYSRWGTSRPPSEVAFRARGAEAQDRRHRHGLSFNLLYFRDFGRLDYPALESHGTNQEKPANRSPPICVVGK